MSTTSINIPVETARHVLWIFGREGGYRPGSFTQRLLELLAHADATNAAKLAHVFPSEAAAVQLAQYDERGILKLAAIATGQPIRCSRCQDEDGPFTEAGLCEPCARPMPLDGVA
jgi:hypothetical protein